MEIELPQIAAFLVSWLSMTAGIWALFERAETVITDSTKATISRWLLALSIDANDKMAKTFPLLMERLYGAKLVSLRSFAISTAISCFSVVICTSLWAALHPQEGFAFLMSDGWIIGIGALFFAALIVNALPDYISLIQSRLILRRLEKTNTSVATIGLVALDFALTTTIIVGTVALFGTILIDFSVQDTVKEIRAGFNLTTTPNETVSWGVFFYTTYTTSAWLWIYIVTGVGIRVLVRSSRILAVLQHSLDFKKKPVRALGFVSMIVVTLIYTTIACTFVL